jgi:5-methylcytosine-specific restriction protein A
MAVLMRRSRADVKVRLAGDRVPATDTRRVQPPAKTADPFYTSPEWRKFIARIKAKRGNRCEDPACTTPNERQTRVIGDHIVELKDGGAPLDPANIMLRCDACHTRKTAAHRAKRLAQRF